VDPVALAAALAPTACAAWPVTTVPTAACPAVAGQLVALRLAPEAAAQARARVRAAARKKRRTPSPTALAASAFLFLFTTLPASQAPAADLVALYRLRWQIELLFKRLKGLWTLGDLAAKDPQLAQSVLLAKLLAAVLMDLYRDASGAFSPWGYGWPTPPLLVAPHRLARPRVS